MCVKKERKRKNQRLYGTMHSIYNDCWSRFHRSVYLDVSKQTKINIVILFLDQIICSSLQIKGKDRIFANSTLVQIKVISLDFSPNDLLWICDKLTFSEEKKYGKSKFSHYNSSYFIGSNIQNQCTRSVVAAQNIHNYLKNSWNSAFEIVHHEIIWNHFSSRTETKNPGIFNLSMHYLCWLQYNSRNKIQILITMSNTKLR